MRRLPVVSLLALLLLTAPADWGGAQGAGSTTKTATKTATKTTTTSSTAKKTTAKKTTVSSTKRPAAAPKATATAAKSRPKAAPRPKIAAASLTGANALESHLRTLLANATNSGRWGVMVVSLSNGDTLYDHNGDELLLPASTMKIYTAAIALERLGPNHRFRTQVLRTGSVRTNGILAGDLILKGAGDPSLAPRVAGGTPGLQPLDALAAQVAAAGIREIHGDLIGDASAFDGQRVPDGWRARHLQTSYGTRVSALSFNENLTTITVRPSTRGAQVAFGQPVSGLDLRSAVTVRPNARGASIRVWQDTLTNEYRVSGWIGARSAPRTYQVVIEQPEQFVAAAFRAALEAQGVRVTGVTRIGRATGATQFVTAWDSPPVATLVTTMNGESNNHFAELLFRNTARSSGAVGSAVIANESLRTFLAERVGIPRRAVFAADGSGLSTLDRVTPRSMIQLLDYSRSASWGPVMQASLPVAGRTETLKNRMRGTAAQGNLRAKTGTTGEVVSLGGYVTAKNGEQLAFSFIYNGADRWRARTAIDAMGVTLASFSR
ncbi:MAG: D-alanyl-D-alanine carboxypeptidase/D-alanyl-D-alanine endopeptidase [Gemmatimonadaceae bacterium]